MPAKKRVFAAINLPEPIKKDLASAIEKIRPLFGREIRFLDPENWHLTVSFLGSQDDNSVGLISEALSETAKEFEPLHIKFEKIMYGPIGKAPRMLWLASSKETSSLLGEIQKFLEEKLMEKNVPFRQENKKFFAHLTIARFESAAKENLPDLNVAFAKSFEAESIDLMESRLKQSAAEYEILSRYLFDFNQK